MFIYIPILTLNVDEDIWGPDAHEFRCLLISLLLLCDHVLTHIFLSEAPSDG